MLAAYLQRDDTTAADGFVVEGFTAGGHNAPPRRRELDETGQTLYGDKNGTAPNSVLVCGCERLRRFDSDVIRAFMAGGQR